MKTDREIWEDFRNGDKKALSAVYFKNFKSLYQYGMKFKDDPEFVKDCIQEVFYRLIKSGRNLGPTDNIQFYLFKALKNVIIKEFDHNRKQETVKSEVLTFHSVFRWEENQADTDNSSTKEKALSKALGSLSDRQKEIIYLRFEKDMSYDQICQIMNIKNDSARKLVFRAIKALKIILEDQVQNPILFLIHLGKKYVF